MRLRPRHTPLSTVIVPRGGDLQASERPPRWRLNGTDGSDAARFGTVMEQSPP
jgi:hypothetical protein